jgi:hypothetical protein
MTAAEHGTVRRYQQHLREDGYPCTPCMEANRTKPAHRYSTRPLAPIKHGTPAGYKQHWYRGVPACTACKNAHSQQRAAV